MVHSESRELIVVFIPPDSPHLIQTGATEAEVYISKTISIFSHMLAALNPPV